MSEKIHRNSLQPGHKLHWYRIEKILGQGGFGITYLAHDFNLDRQVAIKEYLPIELAVRERDFSVHPVTEEQSEKFRWGLDRFITEARTLVKFKHPNIVHVLNVFEENNTAYMVMEYEQGESLQDILTRRKTLEEAELINFLIPILGGLQKVHDAGFIHRDIKPANIFIREDGSPVLLDFGSARQALSMATQTLTSLVSPGYAPYEQYYSKSDQQGPWTDIYGLGATLYRAIAGKAPLDAVDRSRAILKGEQDIFVPASQTGKGRYSERFLLAIDHALQFKEEDRPQTISRWKSEFDLPDDPIKQAIIAERTPTQPGTKVLGKQQQKNLLYSKVAILFVLIGIGVLYLYHGEIQDYLFGPTKAQLEAERQRVEQEKRLAALKEKEEEDRRRKEEEKRAEQERQAELERQRQKEEEVRKQQEEKKQKDEVIKTLLSDAQENFNALRLASPDGNNALEKYNKVLEIEPMNNEANEGIQNVINKYIELSRTAREAKDFSRANEHLNKAEQISPNDERIKSEKINLENAQAKTNNDELFKTALDAYELNQYEKAFPIFKSLAENGHSASQYYLAGMYSAGHGVSRDNSLANKWYKISAKNGYADAQYMYAFKYVIKNDAESMEWLLKAAKQDHAGAQLMVGINYHQGKGILKDNNKAYEWIKMAAEQGYPPAQKSLGESYYLGDIIDIDEIKSFAWLIIAGKYGNARTARVVMEGYVYTSEQKIEAIQLARSLWHQNSDKWTKYYLEKGKKLISQYDMNPWTDSEWKEIMGYE